MTDAADSDVGIDAEAWLRDRGVQRQRLQVAPPAGASPLPDGSPDPRTPVSAREAVRLATEAPPAPPVSQALPVREDSSGPPVQPSVPPDPVQDAVADTLEDEVARAMSYVRRATSSTPMSEGRVRERLGAREFSRPAIDVALERARAQRLIDDGALARALAEEGIGKGHAPARLRRDLRKRGLAEDVIEAALADTTPTDLEAAAFAIARRKAHAARNTTPESAFRRVMGHLARRGYPEALARRVARQAVFEDREPDRISGL